ncbi:transposase [Paraburkholderia sediminicola]|uniref:transposase n=2 Tax=Paraburkholderia sediminicola TaxID=458836 RepID=UPI0009FB0E3B
MSMKEIQLSDEQWHCVEHLFSHFDFGRGRPRRSDREILDAVLWVQTNEAKWHRLPSRYPPQQTCYARYLAWRRNGILQKALDTLEHAGIPLC